MSYIGIFVEVFNTIIAPFILFRTLSKLDWSKSGSGRNTAIVKSGMRWVFITSFLALVTGIAMIIDGSFGTMSWILTAITVLTIVGAIGLGQFVSYKDAQDKKKYNDEKREEQLATAQHKTAMVKTTAQLKAEKAMAKNGAKVVEAKMRTAVATEQAKKTAVESAATGMRIQSVLHPSQALDYAKDSGALDEGKELADKFADKYMGEMAPTVIDGQYRDVTDSGHNLLSQEDSDLVKRIKGLARDTAVQLLERGAEKLMLETEGKSPEEIADNVLKYAPKEYVDTLPEELTDFEKAVVVVERSAQQAAV